MNYRRIPVCIALLICSHAGVVNAQDLPPVNRATVLKPLLFNRFPAKSLLNPEALQSIFLAKNHFHALEIGDQQLQAEMITRVQQNPNVESINFRIPDFPGALLTISRVKLNDGSTKFNGHLVSRDNGDVLTLIEENGKYYFIKEEQRLVMTE